MYVNVLEPMALDICARPLARRVVILVASAVVVASILTAGCASRSTNVAPRIGGTKGDDPCLLLKDGLDVGACYERAGQRKQALRAYRAAAIKAAAMATRKKALLALRLLGQNVAVPQPGKCAALESVSGCGRSYQACALEWKVGGSCSETSGVALQVFSYEKPQSLLGEEFDNGESVPDGPENDSAELATEVESSPPFFYSLQDRVMVLLSADTELNLVSSREVCVGNESEPATDFPSTACHVVMADACSGRVGLVCETGDGEARPEYQVGEFWLHPSE